MFSLDENSLHVRRLDLWIDSPAQRSRCFVSHGHADHARAHATVITSPANAKICALRFSKQSPPRFETHAFNHPWELDGHRLTLFSAGHVLGSSQLMIEGELGTFVYTGDFKLEASLTAEPPEVKRCDVLLMECTYGRPHYVFPPRAEVAAEMVTFARETLGAGEVPVFLAYALGKAQEALAILGNDGIAVTVHGSIDAFARVYDEAGVALPTYERYRTTFDGTSALIWPPFRALPKPSNGRRMRTAVLTGWSLDRSAHVRYGAERGFPLSDHADYPALFRYVELAQPRKVLLNHGRRDFVYRLRAAGIDAEYLEPNAQLSLF